MTTSKSKAEKLTKSRYKITWIPVSKLSVRWAQSQGEFREKHAQNIADNLDPDMFGYISVTLPDKRGIHHIIDGQHRAHAVRILWGNDEQVPCHVYEATDPKRAAEMYDFLNTKRRAPQAIDIYRVRVTEEKEEQVAIEKVLKKLGLKVARSNGPKTINSPQALLSVYEQFGSEVLYAALQVMQATFGDDSHGMSGQLIRGYGAFMAEWGHRANWGRLIKKVQHQYTPGRLIAAAKTSREFLRCNGPTSVKAVLINCYNAGLKGGRLGEDIRPRVVRTNGSGTDGSGEQEAA